jgi:glycosyltransferase involved in cell wall biosynthesis
MTSSQYPLVTVIIPTYNYGRLISKAVESIRIQDYPVDKVEVIIIDDGSQDDTREVVDKLKLNDKGYLYYEYQENAGKGFATARGVELAKGEIIFNLDADDYFLPGKITRTVDVYQKYSEVNHVASSALVARHDGSVSENIPIDITNRPIDGKELLKRFYCDNILFGGGSTFSARSSVLKGVNIPGNVDMYIDEYLILVTLIYGKTFIYSEPLSVWLVHGENYSGKTLNKAVQSKKDERLLNSSYATLIAVMGLHSMPEFVKKAYIVKDTVRRICALEKIGAKKFSDILRVSWTIYQCRSLGIKALSRQYIFKRIIPQFFFDIIKNV